MSRSYKKTPIIKYEDDKNEKQANKSLRQDKNNLYQNSDYKKAFRNEEWKNWWSKEDAIEWWKNHPERQEQYTLEEWLQYWEKCVKRK
jgi:hypothetical protein